MLIRALVFGLVLSATPWSVFAASLSVPITVTERAGTPRKAEIVSLGVPLSKAEGVTTTDGLQMVDADGRVVTAQFRPLSRWGPLNDANRPIRWVLADFEASVGGKTTATYTLTRVTSGAAAVNGIAVTDTPQTVAVDTGTMTVRVPKGGGYLFEAVVGGRTYRTSGIRILRGEREFSSEAIKPASVTVEERGSIRTVVRINGTYHTADGAPFLGGEGRFGADPQGRPAAQNKPFEYTVWLTAYRAKSALRVRVRFENNGRPSWAGAHHPSNDIFMDGVYLDTELPASALGFKIAGAGKEVSLSGDQRYSLLQTHVLRDQRDESKNFTYTVTRDSETIASGSRLDGWLGVAGAGSAITVAVNRFWQEYPKRLEVRDGRLSVGLWPAEGPQAQVGAYGRGRHFFSGGWHKTHDMLLVYHGEDPRGTGDQAPVMSLLSPLAVLASPTWIASTGAWGAMATSALKSSDRELQEALDRYARYQRILIDPAASTKDRLTAPKELGLISRSGQFYLHTIWSSSPR